MVEPAGAPRVARLDRGGAAAAGSAERAQTRPRPQGVGLLWAAYNRGTPRRRISGCASWRSADIPLTTAFLAWCCDRLAGTGITTLALVWDNAPWHVSEAVRRWLRDHNQRAHREGGVRLVPCWLPTERPWLNPIEPHWVHGKRRVVEPTRLLTAAELEARVCAVFDCTLADNLESKEVA